MAYLKLFFIYSDPERWRPTAKWTDFYLLQNSMAFDLGLDNPINTTMIDALIANMDENFALVDIIYIGVVYK